MVRVPAKHRYDIPEIIPEYINSAINWIVSNKLTSFYILFLCSIIVLGIVGPMITPHKYDERVTDEQGKILLSAEPSAAHPLGTTTNGYDVFSRLLYGARPTVITGLIGGLIIITAGVSIGMTAGYMGGIVDEILMRITDFAYGVPLIPFAIVMLALLDVGFFTSILVIGLILWRGSARVIRAQVLGIKHRPFILAAKATGAHPLFIMRRHILPNIAPMAAMFFALGVGMAILIQAGLTFVGVTNPFIPSWGTMVRNAYSSGMVSQAPYWSLPPGFLISLTVLSTVMLGREIESRTSEEPEGDVLAESGV